VATQPTNIGNRDLRRLPGRALRWAARMARRALGIDYTDRGERVDIRYRAQINFERLDIYQKSHYRRYQFACGRVGPSDRVGDLACGTGYGTVMLASVAGRATGYDISPVIDVVRSRYAKIPNVTFVQTDILRLEAKGEFDSIVSFETLEHFSPPLVGEVLGKFNAMLKEDGQLIVSTPYNQEETPASRLHHRSFNITEGVLKGWVEGAGFTLGRIYYQNYQTHELQENLASRDFMVAVCRKSAGAAPAVRPKA
jgi:2-polyprenyl-3-methyl-5-hydroxy-6-metoxy-1,4-benzoquinol methylase